MPRSLAPKNQLGPFISLPRSRLAFCQFAHSHYILSLAIIFLPFILLTNSFLPMSDGQNFHHQNNLHIFVINSFLFWPQKMPHEKLVIISIHSRPNIPLSLFFAFTNKLVSRECRHHLWGGGAAGQFETTNINVVIL